MVKERVILGIDPGTIVMGYGVLLVLNNKPYLQTMGVLQLNKYEDHYLRLKKIFERVLGLIDQYHPDELAIEAPFFGKNVQSMLKLYVISSRVVRLSLRKNIPIGEILSKKILIKCIKNDSHCICYSDNDCHSFK